MHRSSTMGSDSTAKAGCNIKLLGLIILLLQDITILQALPQRETSTEPTFAGNMMREATVEPKYVFNGIYTSNSIYTITFPPLLMRPELVASYAQVVAKTLPRKVDNRVESQKVTSSRTVTKKDDSVKFPTNRPTTIAPRSSMTPASRIRTENLAIDPEDKRKCDQNFLECKRLSNYPTDIVEKLILEGKINKHLLLNEDIPAFKPVEIDTRFEGSGDDTHGNKKQFCSYKEDVIYPEGGKNNADQYRFIVQAPRFNITQGIRTETCVSEGDDSCGGIKSYLPGNYQIQCVQKYAYKQFVTVSNSGTGTTQEPIKIPSCCVCMYTDKK